MGDDERLTAKQFQLAGGVEDWRVLAFGASAWFAASSHTAGAALVRRVAELTGNAGRLPDVDLRVDGVHVRIRTPGSPGLTLADVAVARAISAAAQDLGLAADPSAVHTVQLAIDTLDKPSVMSFWRAVLGYERLGDDDLVDAMRRDPAIWFQQQDQPRPLRNRIHVDVARPHALALEGVEEAKAVGGREAYVGEGYGTLADAEGNEADVIPDDELSGGGETANWRVLFGAMTFYPVTSPLRAAELAVVVAGLADNAGLPLLVDVRPDGVTIDTGKDQWEDERFGDLARRVQAAARGMALTADPTPLRFVQIGIDAVDIPAVRGFWRAVLGYEYDPRPEVTDIYDPRRLNLPIFFQQMPASEEARRKQRNRIHVDVFVPDDQARARIDKAVAAGGRIVYDDEAPEWWTLADPEGNEVDIAVSVGREELWLATQADAD
ncbi:VOC family protein [Actinopolymorpha alba]|uniref:VOC family protein n=1 Tax=Actinopolymorpha alba TaxID=533267 RepID=UPI0012F63F56|nr:VOC family protein [Actinopolymorpha alba]